MRPILPVLVLLALGAAACDDTSPQFVAVAQPGDTASTQGPYEILATVVDDRRVKRVDLQYWVDRDDSQGATIVPMEHLSGDVWRGLVPGQPAGSRVDLVLTATDGEDHGACPGQPGWTLWPSCDATWSFVVTSP